MFISLYIQIQIQYHVTPRIVQEKTVLKHISELCNVHKAVGHYEQSKTSQMNQKKENIQVNWTFSASKIQIGFLVFKG